MLKWRKWRADRPAPGRTADEGVISDMRIEIQQLRSIINIVGAPPVPPKHLQERVVGGYYADWWESGEALLCSMDQCLRGVRKSIRDFSCILDFGCGPGRVTVPARYYLDEDTEIHATDIDREAISWCCENYGKIASFQANDIDPPFRYSENMFDFCYSISIFTHLPEDMQLRWLAELHRVTKPGGFLILTINTESRFRAMEEQKYVPIVKGKEGGGFYMLQGTQRKACRTSIGRRITCTVTSWMFGALSFKL